MGKKTRAKLAARHTASGSHRRDRRGSASSLDAPIRTVIRRPLPRSDFKPVHSDRRCVVTGAPLARGIPTRVLHDEDGDDPERPIPQSIDSLQPYPVERTTVESRRDYLGGFKWTPEFERYIKPVLPATIERAKLVFHEWWRLPYVVSQLRLKVGAEKLDAVLLYKRDRADIPTVAKRYNHTFAWVTRAASWCYRLVRMFYLPPNLLWHIEEFAATLELSATA